MTKQMLASRQVLGPHTFEARFHGSDFTRRSPSCFSRLAWLSLTAVSGH